jgi:hypothetical protein
MVFCFVGISLLGLLLWLSVLGSNCPCLELILCLRTVPD